MNEINEPQSERMGLARVVELTRRHLGVDVAFVSELTESGHVYAAVAGDAESFRIRVSAGPVDGETVEPEPASAEAGPPGGALCEGLASGEIPAVAPDATSNRGPEDTCLMGDEVGAFVAVPLRLSDGTTFGALCGLSRAPRPDLDERDSRFLAMLGEVIVDELDERRRDREMRADLMRVIERADLQVAFQPIIDLTSGRCVGVEALARFPEPFTRPDRTLSHAQRLGLSLELERLVVIEAWKILPELGSGQFLALNLSPDALVELARRANQRNDLPLSQLVVEVTEHSVIDCYAPLSEELAPLRERGLRIAVDDAGAGYASLRHVLELRPDFVKVDRSLIHGIARDRTQRVAVGAFQSLAQDLQAVVVAEGVERSEDLDVALELGLQAAQGYLLGRPSTDAEVFSRWIGQGEHLEPTLHAGRQRERPPRSTPSRAVLRRAPAGAARR